MIPARVPTSPAPTCTVTGIRPTGTRAIGRGDWIVPVVWAWATGGPSMQIRAATTARSSSFFMIGEPPTGLKEAGRFLTPDDGRGAVPGAVPARFHLLEEIRGYLEGRGLVRTRPPPERAA